MRPRTPNARCPRASIRGDVRTGGFTLLELLIATAVGAVVLVVIQTSFFGALRLHNTTHARAEADLSLQRALGIIRRDFAGLMLPGGVLSGQLQTTVFSSSLGDSFGERVTPDLFTTSGKVDGWNPFSEAQMVAYFLAPTHDGSGAKDLVRAVKRNLLPVQDQPGEPQVLLRGVMEATLEFYDGAGWIGEWDSESTSMLPNALKLRLVLATEAGQRASTEPVELVVPVLVKTSASAAAEAAEAAGL
jgi:type II secretion system protein J